MRPANIYKTCPNCGEPMAFSEGTVVAPERFEFVATLPPPTGWKCPQCGAGSFNRLTPNMVKEQLGVMAYLYGDNTNRPQTGKVTNRQLELFGRK